MRHAPSLFLFGALALAVALGACSDDAEPENERSEVLAPSAPIGIRGGSFEACETGKAPGGDWVANDVATKVLPIPTLPPELRLGFPSHGTKWLQIDAGAKGPCTRADYLEKGSWVRQDFRCGDAGTFLALDVAMVNYEIPGNAESNDFMAVDVVSGEKTVNLLLVDNATGDFTRKTNDKKPCSRKFEVVRDLKELFPDADGDTVFTLYVSSVNFKDPGADSKVFVDNVRLLDGAPPGPFTTRIVKDDEQGFWKIVTDAGIHRDRAVSVRHVMSKLLATPTGSGEHFYGLIADLDVFQLMQAGLGREPWHVRLDEHGRYESKKLPFAKGTKIDYVAVLMGPGNSIIANTDAQTITLE